VTDTQYWHIVGDVERQDPDDEDAYGWLWTLRHVRTGAIHRLHCKVAHRVGHGGAAPESVRALESQGRSEAERIATSEKPPASVSLGTEGYLEGGPGPDDSG
jgi:hypothetical protein